LVFIPPHVGYGCDVVPARCYVCCTLFTFRWITKLLLLLRVAHTGFYGFFDHHGAWIVGFTCLHTPACHRGSAYITWVVLVLHTGFTIRVLTAHLHTHTHLHVSFSLRFAQQRTRFTLRTTCVLHCARFSLHTTFFAVTCVTLTRLHARTATVGCTVTFTLPLHARRAYTYTHI